MRPQTIYEELRGQQLTSILMYDPWDDATSLDCPRFRWPLFGALALLFERHALLVSSPLRYLRCQEGTRYGLADGASAALGLRALLCESDQAEALVSWRLGLPHLDVWWGWQPKDSPLIGRQLEAEPWLSQSPGNGLATIHFDFGDELRYRLEYRSDLDGAIELAPDGMRSEPGLIEVSNPKGPFGWLHPRSVRGFVLDDRRWRNTEHWPIEVRRQYRNADPKGESVLQLLKRAWLAYFRQNPNMHRRLLALSAPVRVAGLPEGFVESVQAELRAQSNAVSANAGVCAPAATEPARPP